MESETCILCHKESDDIYLFDSPLCEKCYDDIISTECCGSCQNVATGLPVYCIKTGEIKNIMDWCSRYYNPERQDRPEDF